MLKVRKEGRGTRQQTVKCKHDLVFAHGVQNAKRLHALDRDVVVRELKHLECGVDHERVRESFGSWCPDFVDCCVPGCDAFAGAKDSVLVGSQLRSRRFSVVFVFSASLSSLTLSSLRCTTGSQVSA